MRVSVIHSVSLSVVMNQKHSLQPAEALYIRNTVNEENQLIF